MSFASEVKKEILSTLEEKKCCDQAFVLGVLHGCSSIIISTKGIKLQIKTPILNIIKKIMPILKEQFSIDINIGYANEQIVDKKRRYYFLEIEDHAIEIIEYYKLMLTDELNMEFDLIQKECCKKSFIKGLFTAKGSINDPRKECYHAEIACKRYDIAFIVQQILGESGIEAGITNRRSSYVIYIKRSEYISNLLAFIGATSGVFYFEDSRIYRDYANMANRISNCDVANERKCLINCNRQLEAIAYLKQIKMFDKMPVRLQTIARMREEYPESSLDELSYYSEKIFGKTLSKSGISHCLKDLMDYYQSIIEKNNKKGN